MEAEVYGGLKRRWKSAKDCLERTRLAMVEVMDRPEAEVPYRVKRELAGELYHQVKFLALSAMRYRVKEGRREESMKIVKNLKK